LGHLPKIKSFSKVGSESAFVTTCLNFLADYPTIEILRWKRGAIRVRDHPVRKQLCVTIVIVGFSSLALAQTDAKFEPPADVAFRTASIISEGTRMSAEVFSPKNADHKLPTIVMSHGWGGTADHLRPDGVAFARAGFLVVTFDYRGWGTSDARLVATSKPSNKDGKLVAEVAEVRGVVDPIDQTTDILNALHWVQSEELCDPSRIGIWGSSFSGGHVVYVAARDPRVKAFVSQVGSMDARWAIQSPDLRKLTFSQGTARTRGQIGYPQPFARFGGMTGQPVWEKLMRYAPIEDIDRCENCAKLFIIAENEELFDNKDHAIAAYNQATGVKKLVTVEGIKHYGIYTEKRQEAQQLAIDWFREHL
jgi:dienelactone hydrolase